MTAGQGARTLGQAVVFLIVARVLGAEQYGAYAAVLALAMTFGGCSGLGVSVIMLRETSRDLDAFTEAWGRTLAALLVTAVPLLGLYFLLAAAIFAGKVAWGVIVCLGVAEIALAPLTLVTMRAFMGHERVGRAAALALIAVLPRFVVATLVMPLMTILPVDQRLSAWAGLYLTASTVAAGYMLFALRRDLGARITFLWSGLRRVLGEGWPFSVGESAYKIYADIDKIMLLRLATLNATGAYSAAYRVVEMGGVPLVAFFSAAMTRFFRAGSLGTHGALRYALRILPLPMVYAVTLSIGLYLLAGLLPWLLGTGFGGAVDALRWLAWLPLLTTPRGLMFAALEASGRQRATMVIIVGGAAFNAALNLSLIPAWSWQGAVWATYAAEVFMTIMLTLTLMRAVKSR